MGPEQSGAQGERDFANVLQGREQLALQLTDANERLWAAAERGQG